MPKLNLLVHLNAYSDAASSNNPNLNNLKWSREINGLSVNEPRSDSIRLGSGDSVVLFNGARPLQHDGTTEYSLSKKAGTSNTYVLEYTGTGTEPRFRRKRELGTGNDTEISLTKNANLMTLQFTGGAFDDLTTITMNIGDKILVGAGFAAANQGTFTVLGYTADSISYENASGVPETVNLTAEFDKQLRVFAPVTVQKGDTLAIKEDFSILTQNSYEITNVTDYYVEFYSTASLPEETVVTNGISIYSNSKTLVYIETTKKIDITYNETQVVRVLPIIDGTTVRPGIFMLNADVYSLSIQNSDAAEAEIFVASVEK